MPQRTVLFLYQLRPRRIGGIETMIREMSAQLAKLQWNSVICFRTEPTESVRQFLDLPNICLENVDFRSTFGPASNAKLARLVRKHRPAIMHLNFLDFFSPYASIAKFLGVRDIYFTDHISRPEGFGACGVPFWKRSILRATVPVTGVFCVSDYVRQCWCVSERLPESTVKTVYNGVDLERCRASDSLARQFRERYSIPPDRLVVAQVAKMISEKGFVDLLHAAKRVTQSQPNTVFVLAGDGPEQNAYVSLAQNLGIDQHVIFTGLVDDPVGWGLFAAADVVCQSSRWNEAFGLAIAEAMACGKPVIGTRVGGIPELVRHGETGFIIEKGDRESLALCIIELSKNTELRLRMGRQGRERCSRKFDHRKNATAMIRQYGLVPTIHQETTFSAAQGVRNNR